MSEFDEGVLKLRHAKELFMFSHLLMTNPLALLRIQARGEVKRLGLSDSGIVVLGWLEWRHGDPRHIDEL